VASARTYRPNDIEMLRSLGMSNKLKLGLIIIDYLQFLISCDPKTPRGQQISEISRVIKVMAKELDLPVIF
jgi:replicative DNA helicase